MKRTHLKYSLYDLLEEFKPGFYEDSEFWTEKRLKECFILIEAPDKGLYHVNDVWSNEKFRGIVFSVFLDSFKYKGMIEYKHGRNCFTGKLYTKKELNEHKKIEEDYLKRVDMEEKKTEEQPESEEDE